MARSSVNIHLEDEDAPVAEWLGKGSQSFISLWLTGRLRGPPIMGTHAQMTALRDALSALLDAQQEAA